MIEALIGSLVLFALFFVMMSIGYFLRGKCLKGSCGGLNQLFGKCDSGACSEAEEQKTKSG